MDKLKVIELDGVGSVDSFLDRAGVWRIAKASIPVAMIVAVFDANYDKTGQAAVQLLSGKIIYTSQTRDEVIARMQGA